MRVGLEGKHVFEALMQTLPHCLQHCALSYRLSMLLSARRTAPSVFGEQGKIDLLTR